MLIGGKEVKEIVIYKKDTNEVIASISEENIIMQKDFEIGFGN